MIETLSKLSRTPIAIATGIRYVVGLVSGGNNASCTVLVRVAVGGHIGRLSVLTRVGIIRQKK